MLMVMVIKVSIAAPAPQHVCELEIFSCDCTSYGFDSRFIIASCTSMLVSWPSKNACFAALQGFPYVPMTEASRRKQQRQVHDNAKLARDGDPLTVDEWRHATFQERFLQSFKFKQETYVVVLDVCGKLHRMNYWQMMNRIGN